MVWASANLTIGISLKIIGASAATTIIDGGGVNTVITVSSPAQVTLSRVTVRNGAVKPAFANASGGGILNHGILSVNASTISANTVAATCPGCVAEGGGIYNSGTLTLNQSTLSSNSATASGEPVTSIAEGGGIGRDLPLDFHPYAQKAAEAARCAGDQNKFWELRDHMITHSADLSQGAILKMAQAESLDMATFRACLDADKHEAEIQKDAADASTLGISGTPSFVIGKASRGTLDGDRLVGAVAASVFEAEFQKFLPSTP